MKSSIKYYYLKDNYKKTKIDSLKKIYLGSSNIILIIIFLN